jgi:hypothetical protein
MEQIDDFDEDVPAVAIYPDDMKLLLDSDEDSDSYADKLFVLELIDCEGNSFEIHMDGIQVGDIIADAREAGLPVEWPYPDGVPRVQNPDGSWGLPPEVNA